MPRVQAYFYHDPNGVPNFGDDLNTILLPKLFPGLMLDTASDVADTVVLGIGTILNSHTVAHLARYRQKVVFSSGYGYDQSAAPLKLGPDWTVNCVRGPLTARAVHLPAEAAVTDGAMLVARLLPQSGMRATRPAFMPHVSTAIEADEYWRQICEAFGMTYLDPRSPIEPTLAEIACASFVVTEALHGAISADAYRTPWVPVRINGAFAFKWQDWCASLNMTYKPIVFPPVWPKAATTHLARLRLACKTLIIKQRLARLVARPPVQLSAGPMLAARLDELEKRAAILAGWLDR